MQSAGLRPDIARSDGGVASGVAVTQRTGKPGYRQPRENGAQRRPTGEDRGAQDGHKGHGHDQVRDGQAAHVGQCHPGDGDARLGEDAPHCVGGAGERGGQAPPVGDEPSQALGEIVV